MTIILLRMSSSKGMGHFSQLDKNGNKFAFFQNTKMMLQNRYPGIDNKSIKAENPDDIFTMIYKWFLRAIK